MLQDFEQKTKNKPIKITDIAISKVRRTKISNFTDEENKYIQDAHKELLRISKEQNNSDEIAIVIDLIHWNSEVAFGKGNRVCMDGNNPNAKMMIERYPKHTVLVMHNHPSCGPFSSADFKMFCLNDPICIMTIVGNDGSVHVMEKGACFDGPYILLKYGKIAEMYAEQGYSNNGTMAMKYVMKHPEEFNLYYKYGGKKNEK